MIFLLCTSHFYFYFVHFPFFFSIKKLRENYLQFGLPIFAKFCKIINFSLRALKKENKENNF